MRRIRFLCALLAMGLLLSLGLAACGREPAEVADTAPVYDSERISDYLSPLRFSGRVIPLEEGQAKDLAILSLLLSEVEVLLYPDEAMAYYERQIRAHDRYLAKEQGRDYEEYAAAEGRGDAFVAEEAKRMVRTDLLLVYVAEEAGLWLTDGEKAEHYEKYAEKYAKDYGYGRDYVDEHMRDEVYDSMQYDKTMEYLIRVNEFEVRNG